MKDRMTRRQLIKVAALGAGAALTACATATPQIVEVTSVVQQTVQVPVAQTVQVTSVVQQTVQVPVPQTVQVEVTAAPTPGKVKFQVWNQYPCDDKCDAATNANQPVGTSPLGYQWPMAIQRETFLAKWPNTDLIWETHGWDVALQQNVIAALMAGTQPDIIDGEFTFAQYASLGALIPLDDKMSPDVKANAIPGSYKSTLYKGKIFGLAWSTNVFGFMGRKDILGESSITTLPADWAGFLAMCQTVNTKGAGKYWGYPMEGPLGSAFGAYLRATVWFIGADADLTKPDVDFYPWFDNPKAQPVWEFIRSLAKLNEPNLFFQTDGRAGARLSIGKSATMLGAGWDANSTFGDPANKIAPYPCYFGPTPAPPGGHPAGVVLANLQNGALSTSKNPDMAVDWVLNTQRDEVQNKVWFSGRRSLPPTKKALSAMIDAPDNSDPAPANDKYDPPELKAFGKTLRDSTIGVPPVLVTEAAKIWDLYKGIYVDVATTTKAIDAIMKDYQTQADDIWKKATA